MALTRRTIFVSGATSGIGRALAERLHADGNQVIVGGRRESLLTEICAANPGMGSVVLDVADPASIGNAKHQILSDFPNLDMVINAAGIQRVDGAGDAIDDATLIDTVNTNFLGAVRLSSAFLDHLKTMPRADIVHVSSMLAYLPLAQVSIYCATKAALHSFTMSQRWALSETNVRVREIMPPYVQTDLLNGAEDPRAMPLNVFIEQTMAELENDAEEVLVPMARERRDALIKGEVAATADLNARMGTI